MVFVIKPMSAQLVQDHDAFGSSDPYCVVSIGALKQQTAVHSGAGKLPIWHDTLTLNTNDTKMKLQIYDEDTGKDDFIGQVEIDLKNFVLTPNKSQTLWFQILDKKKKLAGRVQVQIVYNGDNTTKPVATKVGNSLGLGY